MKRRHGNVRISLKSMPNGHAPGGIRDYALAMPETSPELLERRARERRLLGELLAQARRDRGITQGEAGNAIGLSQSTIAKIESGVRSVSLLEALGLAEAYRVSLTSLDPRRRVAEGTWPPKAD
jgi:DNA-binding XRE family transcriptional regulator